MMSPCMGSSFPLCAWGTIRGETELELRWAGVWGKGGFCPSSDEQPESSTWVREGREVRTGSRGQKKVAGAKEYENKYRSR